MEFLKWARIIKPFSLGALYILLFSSAFSPLPLEEYHYRIETESQLKIEGSSNVNNFTCDCSCERDFTQSSLDITQQPDNNRIYFSNARLKLTTTNLNCGHKIMNKDLYEALRSRDFPYINISLIYAEMPVQKKLVSLDQSINIDAHTRITLAGQDKRVRIPVKGRKLDGNLYHFTGVVDLKMTDFGITPPVAMLGLIKVNDKITINLELIVRMLDT